jgi:hypothetical protein
MSPHGAQFGVVRSYQRIFRPDRRIYQVEGRRIPIPGGIPLVWLGYATATIVAVLLLGARSLTLSLLLAVGAALLVGAAGDRRVALIAAAVVLAGSQTVGALLSVVDWPLRLLVLPGLVATLATQATPDGRSAHRYALSWLWLQVRPSRRWFGRALPVDERRRLELRVGIAPDHRSPRLRRGRVTGPAAVVSSASAALRVGRWPWNRGRAVLEPGSATARRGRRALTGPLELRAGERLEVRP